MSKSVGGSDGVDIYVCLTCGKDRMVEAGQTPSDAPCEKCGSQVFRPFHDSVHPGQAEADFDNSTRRETAPDEPAPQTEAGDLSDLNNP